jgi:hypothetical protein
MQALVNRKLIRHSITFLTIFILLMGIDIAQAAHEIDNGTTLRINPGMTVLEYGSSTILTGGNINNQGTMIIKGNLVNLNATQTVLGTGTIEFAGTSAQTISGPNLFTNLTINNTAGVSLTGTSDNQVDGTLTLTNGLLKLDGLNLLMGSTAIVSGTPSASAMIVPTGNGELRKEFASLTSFTYPVGDADGTAEYSPVTANFTAGTFSAGNYLGVNLRNVRDPALATDNYLKRYWTLNSTGITNINCALTFNFTDEDVNGTKADLYCLKTVPALETYNKYVSGNQLTGTVTSFGRFTGSSIIDISPNITTSPNIMHGTTNFVVVVKITELNNSNTNGLITVLVPKDIRLSFNYNPTATLVGGYTVNNSAWSYNSSDPNYHIFTTTNVIPAGSFSQFGIDAVFAPGYTIGSYSITSQITSWSGGENRINNNVDAEKLNYFFN